MNRIARTLLLALSALPAFVGPAGAKDKAEAPALGKQSVPAGAGTGDAANAAGQKIPGGPALSILIRRTLLALNDANLTGNYTVFRDLAAPGFQSANNAAKLGEIFSNLRNRGIDLAPVMYFDPKLVRQPAITPNGMLRVSGFIPSKPEQVNFDMMFEKVEGRWRLFGIAVNTSSAHAKATPLDAAGASPSGNTPASAVAGSNDEKN
jgi:hypothetical protein